MNELPSFCYARTIFMGLLARAPHRWLGNLDRLTSEEKATRSQEGGIEIPWMGPRTKPELRKPRADTRVRVAGRMPLKNSTETWASP